MERRLAMAKNEPQIVEVKAVVDGELVDIESVKDPIFSEKMIGDGMAINPKSPTLYAPISGKLIEVADTGHAYYLEHESGLKVLIHVGHNSFYLNNNVFHPSVINGDWIEQGDILGDFDLDLLEANHYNTTVIVIALRDEQLNISFEKCKETTVQARTSTTYQVNIEIR